MPEGQRGWRALPETYAPPPNTLKREGRESVLPCQPHNYASKGLLIPTIHRPVISIVILATLALASVIGCSAAEPASPTVTPTPTPGPTATVAPTPSHTPTSTPDPPTSTPTPTLGSTATATPTPLLTPTPVPTPHPNPNLRYSDEKQLILDLINEERLTTGVEPLLLGDNVAPQIHAEDSLEGCYSSVWSADGLKTVARYSLAGGYQGNYGIALGSDYCADWLDVTLDPPVFLVADEIRRDVNALLDPNKNPSIRNRLLQQRFKALNVGLAIAVGPGDATVRMMLLLESDYIEFAELPAIQPGTGFLRLSGRVEEGIDIGGTTNLSIAVNYDPPPTQLTTGQIARVYSSDTGIRVAAIRPPTGEGRRWTSDESTRRYNPCLLPYDVPADSPPPTSRAEASALYDGARAACEEVRANEDGGVEITYPRITTEDWNVERNAFDISADLSEVIAEHGPGIYVIRMWGALNGQDVLISEYAIFYEVTPPSTYDPPQ